MSTNTNVGTSGHIDHQLIEMAGIMVEYVAVDFSATQADYSQRHIPPTILVKPRDPTFIQHGPRRKRGKGNKYHNQ